MRVFIISFAFGKSKEGSRFKILLIASPIISPHCVLRNLFQIFHIALDNQQNNYPFHLWHQGHLIDMSKYIHP